MLDLEDKLGEYQRMEKNLRDTLLTAERLTQESRESAAREGDLIIRDAEMKARGVLEECRLRTEELRREITGLRKEKETYLGRFRSLAEAQIQFIDTHRSDFEDLDRRLTDIVDTVVTRTGPAAPVAAPAWNNPYVAAPASTFVAQASGPAPSVPVAPAVPVAASSPNASSAPSAPFAPSVSANDIWRDYSPGRTASAAPPANFAQPQSPFHQPAAAMPRAYEPDEDLNGVIAQTLSEVAPVHGPEPQPVQPEAWKPEPVVTEVANV
jgi:vacuolar-type H+-ATPase subunit H